MTTWSFQFTDRNFVVQGEIINLKSAKVLVPLSKLRTASLNIRLDNPLASFVAQASQVEPIYMKAFRNGKLEFFGPVMTVQEAGEGTENQISTLQINAVSPEFIWAFNFTHSETNPKIIPAGTQRVIRFKEFAELWIGSTVYNNDHIDFAKSPVECSNTEAIELPSFKTLMDFLNELSGSAAGFDWTVRPIEPDGSGKIGSFEAKDLIGIQQPNSVFEWGGGRNNISKFNRTIDMTQMANLVYNISGAGPNAPGAPTVNSEWIGTGSEEAVRLAEVWGLRQASMPLNVLSTALRQKYVDEAAKVRRLPRQTVSFTPIVDDGTGRVPVFGKDYNLGDFVRGRIIYEKVTHWDVFARVWGVQFDIDSTEKETQTLTLSDT